MDKIKLKDYFHRRIEVDPHRKPEDYIHYAIQFIREEYGIETNRHELLVEITQHARTNQTTRTKERVMTLIIKPTQELLRKFEKDFPEMII